MWDLDGSCFKIKSHCDSCWANNSCHKLILEAAHYFFDRYKLKICRVNLPPLKLWRSAQYHFLQGWSRWPSKNRMLPNLSVTFLRTKSALWRVAQHLYFYFIMLPFFMKCNEKLTRLVSFGVNRKERKVGEWLKILNRNNICQQNMIKITMSLIDDHFTVSKLISPPLR